MAIVSRTISTPLPGKQADTLLARFMGVERNGNLARYVRSVVASHKRKATRQNSGRTLAVPAEPVEACTE